jgi:agmatine deiminase
MISDFETSIVYFSDLLRTKKEFSGICENICDILDKHSVNFDFLKNTKDIWARDYMPIQVSKDKFIEYRYDPDYLQAKKYRSIKSYPDIICETNNISTQKTDLIIDGGNVIKSNDLVIMTDKVIRENKENYNRDIIVGKLKELFETDKIALIPWDIENDKYGHADGMIRFLDNQNVLLQGYYDSYNEKFKNQLFGELDRIGLKWKLMEFHVKVEDKRNWAYMNFLQTKDLILIPKFGIDEDIQAFEQIEKNFPDYKARVSQVDMTEIVKFGGALNCITWTIKA